MGPSHNPGSVLNLEKNNKSAILRVSYVICSCALCFRCKNSLNVLYFGFDEIWKRKHTGFIEKHKTLGRYLTLKRLFLTLNNSLKKISKCVSEIMNSGRFWKIKNHRTTKSVKIICKKKKNEKTKKCFLRLGVFETFEITMFTKI